MDRYPDATWAGLIRDFLDHERAVGGLAAETLRHRDLAMRTFAAWWERDRPGEPPAEASTADLAAFLVAEADRGMSAATRKAQTAVLRRFYSWLVLTGRGHADPTVHLRGPGVAPTEVPIYTPTEAAAILEHTATLDDLRGRIRHTIVATLRFTGMRSGELRTLRLDHLALEAGEARVIGKGAPPAAHVRDRARPRRRRHPPLATAPQAPLRDLDGGLHPPCRR